MRLQISMCFLFFHKNITLGANPLPKSNYSTCWIFRDHLRAFGKNNSKTRQNFDTKIKIMKNLLVNLTGPFVFLFLWVSCCAQWKYQTIPSIRFHGIHHLRIDIFCQKMMKYFEIFWWYYKNVQNHLGSVLKF